MIKIKLQFVVIITVLAILVSFVHAETLSDDQNIFQDGNWSLEIGPQIPLLENAYYATGCISIQHDNNNLLFGLKCNLGYANAKSTNDGNGGTSYFGLLGNDIYYRVNDSTFYPSLSNITVFLNQEDIFIGYDIIETKIYGKKVNLNCEGGLLFTNEELYGKILDGNEQELGWYFGIGLDFSFEATIELMNMWDRKTFLSMEYDGEIIEQTIFVSQIRVGVGIIL
jgi:hypothetical protein